MRLRAVKAGVVAGMNAPLANLPVVIYQFAMSPYENRRGPSGCGKSTLLRTLNRMYDLYPG